MWQWNACFSTAACSHPSIDLGTAVCVCFPARLRFNCRFLSLGRVQQTCWKAASVQRRGFRAKLRRPAKLKDLTSAGNIDIDAESVTASLRPVFSSQLDGLGESASKLAITTRPIFCTLTQPSLLVLQICTLSDPRPQSRLAAIHRIGGWKDSRRKKIERFSLRCLFMSSQTENCSSCIPTASLYQHRVK